MRTLFSALNELTSCLSAVAPSFLAEVWLSSSKRIYGNCDNSLKTILCDPEAMGDICGNRSTAYAACSTQDIPFNYGAQSKTRRNHFRSAPDQPCIHDGSSTFLHLTYAYKNNSCDGTLQSFPKTIKKPADTTKFTYPRGGSFNQSCTMNTSCYDFRCYGPCCDNLDVVTLSEI